MRLLIFLLAAVAAAQNFPTSRLGDRDKLPASLSVYEFRQGPPELPDANPQRLRDISRNQLHAFLGSSDGGDSNDPAWEANNNGILFGSDDYIRIPAAAMNGARTLGLIVDIPASTAAFRILWSGGLSRMIWFVGGASGFPYVQLAGQTDVSLTSRSNDVLSASTKQCLVLVMGNPDRFYQNGTEVSGYTVQGNTAAIASVASEGYLGLDRPGVSPQYANGFRYHYAFASKQVSTAAQVKRYCNIMLRYVNARAIQPPAVVDPEDPPDTDTTGFEAQPTTVTTISPGENWQDKINAAPAGTTFLINPGVHRQQTMFINKNNITIWARTGAIMNGSAVLSSWTADGSDFVANAGFSPTVGNGVCNVPPLCTYLNDVYRNGIPLSRVGTRAQLATGKYWTSGTLVYVRDNPSGQTMEIATSRFAIHGTGTNVRIVNLEVRQYASDAQQGAVNMAQGRLFGFANNWTIQNANIRYNHGAGVGWGRNFSLVEHSGINDNGQIGVMGITNTNAPGPPIIYAEDGIFRYNECSRNNYASFNAPWEAGCSKWLVTRRLQLLHNLSQNNIGYGLWTDFQNKDSVIEHNVSTGNFYQNIAHEVSNGARIQFNTSKYSAGNNPAAGLSHAFLFAGIISQSSGGAPIQINSNYLTIGANNGNGLMVEQSSRGDSVGPTSTTITNNVIHFEGNPAPGFRGITGYVCTSTASGYNGGPATPCWQNVFFTGNDYYVPNTAAGYFSWSAGAVNYTTWRTYGHDSAASGSTIQTGTPVFPTAHATGYLSGAIVGVAYSKQFSAIDGGGGYTWAHNGGTLPTGMAISSSGLLSGTPTVAGRFVFTLRVTGANGTVKDREYSIVVTT